MGIRVLKIFGPNIHLRQKRLRASENDLAPKLIAADKILAARYISENPAIKDDLIDRIAEYAIGSWVVQNLLADYYQVSKEEIELYYRENIASFRNPAFAEIQHLFIAVHNNFTENQKNAARKRMEKALKEYRTGADFIDICRKYSEDPDIKKGSAQMRIRQGTIAPVLDKAIFSLKTNETSEIIESRTGFHVFHIIQMETASTAGLDEVSESISRSLKKEKGYKKWQEMYSRTPEGEEHFPLIELDSDTAEMNIKINGNIFDRKQLEIINIIMTGNQNLDISALENLNTRLERALTASHDPLYKKLFNDPLYTASVNLVRNWYLARKYSFETADNAGIPDKSELLSFYNHHIGTYMIKPERRASMIFIPINTTKDASPLDKHYAFEECRKRVDKIAAELGKGVPFSELAVKHSAHASAANGGNLGWLKEPSFYEADTTLSKMEPGGISAPVKSTNGYFIFQLHEVKEARPKSFDDIEEQVLSEYLRGRRIETWDRLLLEAEKESGLFDSH